MLNKSQQEILDTLTAEFEKLNSTPSPKGNLINIGALLDTKIQGDKRIAEIEAINDSRKTLRQELVNNIARVLQSDLAKLGMKPEVRLGFVTVKSVGKHVCHSKEFTIYVEFYTTYEYIGGKSRTLLRKPFFRVGANSGQYLTIESLVEGSDFKKSLEILFNEIHF